MRTLSITEFNNNFHIEIPTYVETIKQLKNELLYYKTDLYYNNLRIISNGVVLDDESSINNIYSNKIYLCIVPINCQYHKM